MLTENRNSRVWRLAGGIAAAFGTTCLAQAALAQDAPCDPQDGAEFVCGAYNIEKLTQLDGTKWAVGGAAAGGPNQVPPLYLLNLDTDEVIPVDPASIAMAPDPQAFPDCAAPEMATVESIGVDVRRIGDKDMLYVVNHGDRMTTEVFEVATDGDLPALTWKGCIGAADEHWFLDDLAILHDGGMVMTSLLDPSDKDFLAPLTAGKPYGKLGIWRPEGGWTEVAIGDVSGPNGLIISPDESTAYFGDWAGKALVRIDLASGKMDRVELDFLVDNVMWSEDGTTILAGGQSVTPTEAFGCFGDQTLANCEIPFSVVAVDPATLAVTPIHGPGLLGVMGSGTGALQSGEHLWLTSFRSDRLAKIPYAAK